MKARMTCQTDEKSVFGRLSKVKDHKKAGGHNKKWKIRKKKEEPGCE
jgi:hypothetical protein